MSRVQCLEIAKINDYFYFERFRKSHLLRLVCTKSAWMDYEYNEQAYLLQKKEGKKKL